MGMPVSSMEIGQAVCDALKIDIDGVASLEIKLRYDQPVTVTVERHLNREEGEKLISVLKAYRWQETNLRKEPK